MYKPWLGSLSSLIRLTTRLWVDANRMPPRSQMADRSGPRADSNRPPTRWLPSKTVTRKRLPVLTGLPRIRKLAGSAVTKRHALYIPAIPAPTMARSRTSLSLSFGVRSRDEAGAGFASVGRASALAAVAARATNARREIFDAMARPPVDLTSEPCGAVSSGSSICRDYWTRNPITQSLHRLPVIGPKRRPLLALRLTASRTVVRPQGVDLRQRVFRL